MSWQQTPEGRKRMSEIMKARHAAKRQQFKSKSLTIKDNHDSKSTQIQAHITAYALGHIRCWLSIYAGSHGVSLAELEHQLGKILYRSPGKVSGSLN